ncbi:MAG TPA: HEAT repeat domain-containing protein [Arachidicoccus soli]|nr:HEAT repeat domain-containing protein [Arachidicoccus soli]
MIQKLAFSIYDFYNFDYGRLPIIIQVSIIFIILALLSTISAYTIIVVGRYKNNRHAKKSSQLNQIIDNALMEHIFLNEDIDNELKSESIDRSIYSDFFVSPFNKNWAKQGLVDRLISYKKNVEGLMGKQLKNLYLQLALDKFSIQKLKSRNIGKQIRALNELTEMEISVADTLILPLTNSRNRDLRAAARRAYIKLSKNDPFKFFDIATENLLQWDQIELFSIISSTKEIAIPNFARWVTYSTNKGVVSFCLTLIVYYNQISAVSSVIKLLQTKDHELRGKAINTLGKLKVEEVEEALINIYQTQPQDCQIEILKALGRISSGEYVNFLHQEFLYSTDFEIRKHAAKSLIKNNWAAKEMINELLETASGENKLILKHCLNPLIKY